MLLPFFDGLIPEGWFIDVELVNPKEDDEVALTLNARKTHIKKENFLKAMEITLLLEYSDRSQLSASLQENHSKEKECWVVMSRSITSSAGAEKNK